MKKFQFKLDKLLDYKTKLLDNELLALAALNAELSAVNARIDDMAAARLKCGDDLRNMQLGGGVTPAICGMYSRYGDFLKAETGKARRLAAQIGRRIEKQIEVIKALRMETKSLELLRDSKLKAHRAEEVKEDERRIEDYVNTARLMQAGITP